MRNSLLTSFAVAALVVVTAGAAEAQTRQRPDAETRKERRAEVRTKIENLTPEQREAAKTHMKAYREQRKSLTEQVKAGKIDRKSAAEQLKAWRESNKPTKS